MYHLFGDKKAVFGKVFYKIVSALVSLRIFPEGMLKKYLKAIR